MLDQEHYIVIILNLIDKYFWTNFTSATFKIRSMTISDLSAVSYIYPMYNSSRYIKYISVLGHIF
jgi:hypothetical protein